MGRFRVAPCLLPAASASDHRRGADAAAAFQKVRQTGARIAYELREEPWGQRRFGLIDPSGTWVDVVQQIEPAPGFWDPYME